jgi:hypothetical protein
MKELRNIISTLSFERTIYRDLSNSRNLMMFDMYRDIDSDAESALICIFHESLLKHKSLSMNELLSEI